MTTIRSGGTCLWNNGSLGDAPLCAGGGSDCPLLCMRKRRSRFCAGVKVIATPVHAWTAIVTPANARMAKNKDLSTPLVDIPEKQNPKQCEKKDLKTFNNSMDSVPQFHEYHNLRISLHELAKRWHSQNESDLNCKTSKGSPKQLLENLKIFLKRLHDGKWLKTEAKQ
ncbi:Hypothetical predicted protein [Podarcis lilfordi]|uniref:Uncharacterized protein n=1 Tax=Podarcis lilfordi TaxID=74358 RepID=A0AA35PSZ4_9SAUR|nr:Hypothetical predicted protein [Podarcis lilfordi]